MSRAVLRKTWDAIAVFDKREFEEWLLGVLAIPIDRWENRYPEGSKTLSLSMQIVGKKLRLCYGCVKFFLKRFLETKH